MNDNSRSRGEVDVWLMPFSSIAEHERRHWEGLLSHPERTRLRQCAVQRPRDQSLAARALLRTALARRTSVPGREWAFERTTYGRPYIVAPVRFRHLRFNVTHTGGLVGCALSADHEVGIDAEAVDRDVDFMNLASTYFSPVESESLERLEPDSARGVFFSYWTLKEAYIKARGMGLSIPLDAFRFDLNDASPRLYCTNRCADDPRQWQFFQLISTNEHRLALAVAAPQPTRLKIRRYWMSPALEPIPGCAPSSA